MQVCSGWSAWNFIRAVDVDARLAGIGLLGGAHHDAGGVDLVRPRPARRAPEMAAPEFARDHRLHARAHEGRVGANQRHRLALHVRAHQGAVGVVRSRGTGSARRRPRTSWRGDTSIRSTRSGGITMTSPALRRDHQVLGERARLVDARRWPARRGTSASSMAEEIDHLAGDLASLHPAERGLDRSRTCSPARMVGERVDQADVGAFRRLDRADAGRSASWCTSPHLEARALAPSGRRGRSAERAALWVGDLRRAGFRLVHELRQLRGTRRTRARRLPRAWRLIRLPAASRCRCRPRTCAP